MPHQCTSCGRAFEDGSKEMLSGCPECGGNKFQFMPAGAIDGTDGGAGQRAATAPKKTPEKVSPADANAPETGGTRRDGSVGRGSAPSETQRDSSASAVDRAAATVRDWVGRGDETGESSSDDASTTSTRADEPATESSRAVTDSASAETGASSAASGSAGTAPETVREDSAQASARSDVVSQSELPDDLPEAGPSIQRTPGATEDDAQPPAEEYDEENVVSAPNDQNPGLKELREELNSQFESIRIVNPGQYELNLMELYEREEYIISLQEDGKYVIEVPDAWDAVDR